MDSFLIIFTGALVAISCSLLGCYLILRKMAMVGDAISHAVLPGIVIAYFIAADMESVWLILGAGIFGMITTFLIEFFHQKGQLQTDASIGVTFTWMFAVGVILVTYYAGNAHIDQDCILYGEIAYVPIDVIPVFGGAWVPKALVVISIVLALILAFIGLFYRELQITTFDPGFAAAIGISTGLWHYALMGLVSLTTVASFESVGAILVVALLVVPPATAYLITKKLSTMLWLSCGFGVVSAVLGYLVAYVSDGSIAGAMVTVAGVMFAGVFAIKQVSRSRSVHANPKIPDAQSA